MKQVEMAKALGLSKGTVSKLVARGMPLDSVDAAQAWRAPNSAEGTGHKSTTAAVAEAARAIGERPHAPSPALAAAPDDQAGTLARMRETELRAYNLISAALEKAEKSQRLDDYAALPGLIRSHNQAAANSLAAAAAWEKHCRAAGQVAPVEHLRTFLETCLEPLSSQLDHFPRTVAAQANPSDPAVAEQAIAAGLKALRQQIAATIAKPVPPPAAT